MYTIFENLTVFDKTDFEFELTNLTFYLHLLFISNVISGSQTKNLFKLLCFSPSSKATFFIKIICNKRLSFYLDNFESFNEKELTIFCLTQNSFS